VPTACGALRSELLALRQLGVNHPAVSVALLAIYGSFAVGPVRRLLLEAGQMDAREDVQRDLQDALAAAGGRATILRCRGAAVNSSLVTALAW
jgi:hypothetical protein